jgi:hypothetical protein
MASTYSALKIELIATGEQSGTWGATTNVNLGTALEEAIVGRANAVFASDADLTITLTNANTTQVARNYILDVTSGVSLSTTRNLIVPTINKPYIIENNTTGGQSIIVKTAAGTGVTVPNGRKAMVYADGTNVVPAFDFATLNGGTINNTVIGGTTPAAATFTTLNSTGATTLNGTTIPSSVTLVSTAATQTLTNKTISGTNNTLSNIGNASLTNSAITFGATSQALGSTVSALNAVSIGQTTRAAGSFTTLNANGNVVLGDATADTISANGRFNTDVVPSTDNARDLGTSALKWKQVYATTFTENGVPVVTQTDIGTAPNEIPLNQYLGNLAYQNADAIAGNVNIGGSITANNASVFSVNSTSDAVRITQTGTGNAFVVEDSASPDATPFVVNTDGTVIVGSSTAQTLNNLVASLQVNGTGFNTSSISVTRFNATAGNSPSFTFGRSRGAAIGTNTSVVSGDTVGSLFFRAADGTSYVDASSISSAVDGTPGTNNMPGRLVFSTTPSGSATPVERMRIDSAGRVGLGGTPSSSVFLSLLGALPTTSADSIGINFTYTIPSSSTTSHRGFFTQAISTQAASFTMTTFRHFESGNVTLGAGSSLTEQIGFRASGMTSGTNVFGYRSEVAAATGRWNFYANGTAQNYFAGTVGIGTTTPDASALLDVQSTTQGVRMPNMTTTQKNAIASPALGLMVFDTTLAKLSVYTGSAWETITSV